MELNELSDKIRLLRAKAGVGLRQLSRLANMSPATLSSIEKGQTSPTLATLHRILKALGTDFAEFFAGTGDEPDSPFFPTDQMRSASDAHRTYTFMFPKREDMRFEMVHEVILPTTEQGEWEVHDCDVGTVMLSGGPGRIEIEGSGTWKLKSGDAFYIKSGLKHRLTNLGKRPLKQLVVMDPPKY